MKKLINDSKFIRNFKIYDSEHLRIKLNQLLNDKNFIKIMPLFKFNTFQALGIKRNEKIYSNVLSWLLNPNETHELGDMFLRMFINNINILNENKRIHLINNKSLEVLEVSREQTISTNHRIDILVEFLLDGINYILVIEIKIESNEFSSQTTHYYSEVEEFFPKHKKIFVYLSVNENNPSDPHFINFKWNKVKEIIDEIINCNRITKDVKSFLKHFSASIKLNLLFNEEEFSNTLWDIYEKYGRMLEFLMQKFEEHKIGGYTRIPKILKQKTKNLIPEDWVFETTPLSCKLYKKSWIDQQNSCGFCNGEKGSLIKLEYRKRNGILEINFFLDIAKKSSNIYLEGVIQWFIQRMNRKFPKYQQYFNKNKLEQWFHYVVIPDMSKIKDYNDLNKVVVVMKTIINLFDKDFEKLIKTCLNPSELYITLW